MEGTCTGRRCDVIMEELAAEAPKPEYKPRKYAPWISERTLKLGKEKAAAMKKGQEHLVRFISKEIRKNLRKDRKERIRKVAVEIEKRMKGNNVLGAYHILRHWYKRRIKKVDRPCEGDLKEIRRTYKELFEHRKLNNQPIDFEYSGEDVDDSIPDEEEIIRALFKMRNRKAPGMTKITAEVMKSWFHLANSKKEGEQDEAAKEIWKKLVEVVQLCFKGEIPKAHTLGVLVIIPKDDKGGVRGIGLLEAIHKLVS